MTIAEHVINAMRQRRKGETIGRRGTPVISFWPMRPKWEKYSNAWEIQGTDGDVLMEDNTSVIPAILQLVYIRTFDGKMCQLAYETAPELKGAKGIFEAQAKYDEARMSLPREVMA